MSEERTKTAIQRHATSLQDKQEWLRRMITQKGNIIEQAQKTIESFHDQLVAVDISLEALRTEYKEIARRQDAEHPINPPKEKASENPSTGPGD